MYCPCGGKVTLSEGVGFFICIRCAELRYAEELVRECDVEFGEDHEHDDDECQIMLARMTESYDEGGWGDSTYDNLNTSGSIGFSVFDE